MNILKSSTWTKKRKENIKLIELYKAFFFSEQLSFSHRNKLLEEITRLEFQNERIESMTALERNEDDLSSITIKQSKLNEYKR